MALQRLAEEDPTFKVEIRRGDRPDHHSRHGRAAPRGAGRPHDPRVQRRRQRRQAAGRLPRDDPQATSRRSAASSPARPVVVASTATRSSTSSPPRAKASSSTTRSRVASSRPSTSRPCEKGIIEALESGIKAGYPMVDVKVELIDGSYHDVDSSEMAFKIAGSMAVQEAARKASPALLEPVMSVEVTTPEDYLGDVIGDLSRRRGKVQGQEQRGNALAVQAYRAAQRNVRLRNRPEVLDPGPRAVHDAVRTLRRGSEQHRRRDRGEPFRCRCGSRQLGRKYLAAAKGLYFRGSPKMGESPEPTSFSSSVRRRNQVLRETEEKGPRRACPRRSLSATSRT